MRFINGLQVDQHGNSVPGAFHMTQEQQDAAQFHEIQAAKLGQIAASAEERLAGGVNEADIDKLCAASGLTISQRIYLKTAVLRRHEPLDKVLAQLRR